MAKTKNEIPKSRKSYLLKMAAKMLVQQGKKYMNNKPESRLTALVEQADTLVNHVGRLKGAAMKAVQTISVEGYDFLPPEVIQVLEKLQSQAPPIDSQVLIEQIKSELGEEKFKLLDNIHAEPMASASIGQVYEATYKWCKVVIKVQYPGVAESVDGDIDTLKNLLKAFFTVTQKKIKFDAIMEEARRVLKLETDYLHEQKSLIKYKELFNGSEYIIPDVFPELTTSKVIVMSKEEGHEYTSWLKTNPSDEQKKRVADQLLMLYIKEFFENQLVQTDPNPANFLINGQGQMILLDFGATMEFDLNFVKDYQILIRKVFSLDRVSILKQVFDLNFLDPRESDEAQKSFVDFLILSVTPFDPKQQPFNFSNNEYSQLIRTKAMEFSRLLKYSAPPKNLIFLHRKLGGIFMLLKRLNIKTDLTEFRNLIIENNYY
ncbi:MAG: AarF/ABC1/UbiB kinase family protein [Bdellovibrionaceae bacterium]|jgi:predicted unusual protein kinase regulating ubiquinone biosynthesis (AarF/ABC1/UbiB family)|nr:AarF/ABC1/UbiB kinase family protein [Pseudobdellovibrionaceae bacterium]